MKLSEERRRELDKQRCDIVDTIESLNLPRHIQARTVGQLSRLALDLSPDIDIANLGADEQTELLHVIRGVRNSLLSQQQHNDLRSHQVQNMIGSTAPANRPLPYFVKETGL